MSIETIITIGSIILGSGLIQFFFNRHDQKDKRFEELENKFKDGLAQEKKSERERYEELEEEFHAGLDEREQTGRSRYEEHKQAIADMSKEHQDQFQKLLEVLQGLKGHDEKISEVLEKISAKQEIFGSSLLGLIHFELIYITDIIKERKYITLTEKATIKSMYEPYRALGGNGLVREAVTHVMTYQVISEAEAKKMDDDIAAAKAQAFRNEN